MRRTVSRWASVGLVLVLAACADGSPSDTPGSPVAELPSTTPVEPEETPSPTAVEPAPGTHELTLEYDGETRTHRLFAAPDYDPATPVPLVIALHPYPSSGAAMSQLSRFDKVAAREGFLVAYPDGINGGFNAMICCGSADDVGYLTELTDHLVREWNVDPDRVYLAGISNGGDLSFRAAVEATGVFAAIGAVSGGFIGPKAAASDYAPTNPVSVITFIGGQDQYAGQFRAGMKAWQRRQDCAAVQPDLARPAPGVTLTRSRCADGSDVHVYVVDGMGHAWPGARTGGSAAPDVGVRATELLWQFFADHPRQPA